MQNENKLLVLNVYIQTTNQFDVWTLTFLR